jgi:hypothetical protein
LDCSQIGSAALGENGQVRLLLDEPGAETEKGKRDRAILSMHAKSHTEPKRPLNVLSFSMRAARALATVLLTLGIVGPPAVAADREAFARTIAEKLIAGKAKTRTHTTDFEGDSLGCITLTTWELRNVGYRGHAFFCEDVFTEEVLGAVLNRFGVVRCHIRGDYVGDGCYDFTICGVADSVCVEP